MTSAGRIRCASDGIRFYGRTHNEAPESPFSRRSPFLLALCDTPENAQVGLVLQTTRSLFRGDQVGQRKIISVHFPENVLHSPSPHIVEVTGVGRPTDEINADGGDAQLDNDARGGQVREGESQVPAAEEIADGRKEFFRVGGGRIVEDIEVFSRSWARLVAQGVRSADEILDAVRV